MCRTQALTQKCLFMDSLLSGERKLEYQVRLNASTTKCFKLLLLVVSKLSKQYT